MTLETLSRDAARVLPADFKVRNYILGACQGRAPVQQIGPAPWLHESTEACAEIMVRVLLATGKFVLGEQGFLYYGEKDMQQISFENYGADPLQAFRTAVLQAVIAMGEGK